MVPRLDYPLFFPVHPADITKIIEAASIRKSGQLILSGLLFNDRCTHSETLKNPLGAIQALFQPKTTSTWIPFGPNCYDSEWSFLLWLSYSNYIRARSYYTDSPNAADTDAVIWWPLTPGIKMANWRSFHVLVDRIRTPDVRRYEQSPHWMGVANW